MQNKRNGSSKREETPADAAPDTRIEAPSGRHAAEERDDAKSDRVSGTRLWLLLMKSYHAMLAYAAETLKDSGLGDSDFRVLEALLHKGPLAVNELGPRVFLTPGSISVAVDRLYKQGLVTRTEDRKDRRIRRVDLTPRGRRVIERVFAAHARRMDALAADLPAKERRRLADSLKLLGRRAARISHEDSGPRKNS